MADGYVTPSDRDYMIRTIIGEAANQPDEGMAGVGHVIMNRVKRGYGKSPTEVMFAKNQFEPWSTRRQELMGYSAEDPAYKRVASIVDGIIGGKIKDPTNGATHFLQEDIVRQRRGGGLPDWAKGGGLKIGDHTFHYPDEPDRAESRPRVASVLDKYTKGGAVPNSATAAAPPSLAEGLSLIDKYTKKGGPNLTEEARVLAGMTPSLENRGAPERVKPQWQRDAETVSSSAINSVPNFFKSMAENVRGGIGQVGEGLTDISKGDLFPSGIGKPPAERTGGGLLKIAGGVLQGLGGASGITPATEMLESGVTNLTGNETAGKAAGLVGNVLSSGIVGKQVNRMRPTVRAQEEIGNVKLSPDEINRLQTNPRLRPMDVNPSLHGKGLGLSVEEGVAKDTMYKRAREHADAAPEAVRDAYTTTVGPAIDPVQHLRSIQQTARDNAAKGFGDAFASAKPVNATPVIEAIDKELKPGIMGVASPGTTVHWGPLEQRLLKYKQKLTDGTSVVSDAQRLHEIQVEMGREIRTLSKSATGTDQHLASEMKPFHDKLVKQIDDATGGKYQPARKKYKDDMEIEEAYRDGFDFFRNRGGFKGATEDSPTAWREAIFGRKMGGSRSNSGQLVGGMSPEEIAALKHGVRASVEQAIMGFRHSARRGTEIMDVPYNVQKLEMLFGKTEGKRLARLLKDEKDMAYTNNKLLHNSVTAEKTLNAQSVKPRDLDSPIKAEKLLLPAVGTAAEMFLMGGVPTGAGAMFGTAAIAAKHVANRLGRRSDLARNEVMADILSSGGAAGVRQSQNVAASGNRLLGPPPSVRLPGTSIEAPIPFTYVPEDYRAKRVPLTKD